MQTVEIEYPPPPRHITWISDGPGAVEVSLSLTLQRSEDSEPWRIVAATVAGFAPYVMGEKQGLKVTVDDDWPQGWLDWCRTPGFLERHGADIGRQADEQWERDQDA